MMNIKPLGKRVLIEQQTPEAGKTEAGILIPDTVKKEKPLGGIVIAVGEEVKSVKKGDNVIVAEYSFSKIDADNKEYFLVLEDNILAVVESS